MRTALPYELPKEYLDFLRSSNGGEGEFAVQPYWVVIWSVEEVLSHKQECSNPEWKPGWFFFAGNAGEELIAFDFSSTPYRVIMVPYTGDPEDVIKLAADFKGFMNYFGVKSDDVEDDV